MIGLCTWSQGDLHLLKHTDAYMIISGQSVAWGWILSFSRHSYPKRLTSEVECNKARRASVKRSCLRTRPQLGFEPQFPACSVVIFFIFFHWPPDFFFCQDNLTGNDGFQWTSQWCDCDSSMLSGVHRRVSLFSKDSLCLVCSQSLLELCYLVLFSCFIPQLDQKNQKLYIQYIKLLSSLCFK